MLSMTSRSLPCIVSTIKKVLHLFWMSWIIFLCFIQPKARVAESDLKNPTPTPCILKNYNSDSLHSEKLQLRLLAFWKTTTPTPCILKNYNSNSLHSEKLQLRLLAFWKTPTPATFLSSDSWLRLSETLCHKFQSMLRTYSQIFLFIRFKYIAIYIIYKWQLGKLATQDCKFCSLIFIITFAHVKCTNTSIYLYFFKYIFI